VAARGIGGLADVTRFLVLAPHPDDEVVGCAVAIRHLIAGGDTGFVLYLTTGVPAAATLWPWQRHDHAARVARRRAEAEAVARDLALTPLGFQPWPSRTLKDHIDETIDLVRAIVDEKYIDELWVPAWEGAHQDHDVANFIAAQLQTVCRVIEFAEYNFAGGQVRAGIFTASNGHERVLSLSDEEQRWKTGLLQHYRSERANLAHCRVGQESLRPLATYDYTQPPHDGPLFYERFQWVPFRHPRVDFDPSAKVRAALAVGLHRPAPEIAAE
jgi:hypothetical protein